ncbi:hypothetical protein GEMRC1_003215 [Eukaryota sp. GEM-RC1]
MSFLGLDLDLETRLNQLLSDLLAFVKERFDTGSSLIQYWRDGGSTSILFRRGFGGVQVPCERGSTERRMNIKVGYPRLSWLGLALGFLRRALALWGREVSLTLPQKVLRQTEQILHLW